MAGWRTWVPGITATGVDVGGTEVGIPDKVFRISVSWVNASDFFLSVLVGFSPEKI